MISRYFLLVMLMPQWCLCPGEYGSSIVLRYIWYSSLEQHHSMYYSCIKILYYLPYRTSARWIFHNIRGVVRHLWFADHMIACSPNATLFVSRDVRGGSGLGLRPVVRKRFFWPQIADLQICFQNTPSPTSRQRRRPYLHNC